MFYFNVPKRAKPSRRRGLYVSFWSGGLSTGAVRGCDSSEYLSLFALCCSGATLRERDIVFSSALRSRPPLPQGPPGGEVAGGRSPRDPRRPGTIGFGFLSPRWRWKLLFSPGGTVSEGKKKTKSKNKQMHLNVFCSILPTLVSPF